VDNIVTNLCAKFNDDRLWNEKALVDRKSDNNNPKNINNKNNIRGHWGPLSWSSKRQELSEKCIGVADGGGGQGGHVPTPKIREKNLRAIIM